MESDIDERLSALMDGELAGRETGELLAQIRGRAELRERWARYHLIRDGLRRGLPHPLPHDLGARVARALEREPCLACPPRRAGTWRRGARLALAAGVVAVAILGLLRFGPPVTFPWDAAAPAELAPYLRDHSRSAAVAGYGMLPALPAAAEGTGGWAVTWLPPGFREERRTIQSRAGSGPLEQRLFSNGAAAVSVFLEAAGPPQGAARCVRQGALNACTRYQNHHKITVLGDLPAPTVRRIGEGVTMAEGLKQ